MPPQKSVPTLKSLARDLALFNVCAIVLDEIYFSTDNSWEVFGPPALSVRLQLVRDFLAGALVPSLLEEILNIILSKDTSVDATVRYIALQLLFVDGVRSISIGNFPESFYETVLEVLTINGNYLEKLDLRGLWAKGEDRFHIHKLLRRLSNIKHLTLRYNCDDEMLIIIGKHCSNLQKLDISGSENITIQGISTMCTSRCNALNKLHIFNIGGPGAQKIPPELVSQVLSKLPHMLSLGAYEKTGKAVEILYNEQPFLQINLRYLHDLYTTSERMYAIIKICPQLQALYMDSPKGIVVQNLDLFKNLSELKLHKVRWNDVEILLKKCGTNIRNLALLTVWGAVDLYELGKLCPNLVRLEIHNVSLNCSEAAHSFAFKKVKELLIYTSQINTSSVKFLIGQCISVEHLTFGECAQLTDAAIICNLMDQSLKNVHTIWFGIAENLTMRTILSLIDHCPKLMHLGNIASWDVLPVELEFLRTQLALNNTDLTLYDIGLAENEEEWIEIEIPENHE